MRLLLDELYSKEIAEQLRKRGHDVLAVTEDPDLVGLGDSELVDRMVADRRAIMTNNVADFVSLLADSDHYGLVLTSDRSLPRSRKTIGLFVRLLENFLNDHADEAALRGQTRWLTP